MAKFQQTEILVQDPYETCRFGAGTGAANNWTNAELNKFVKLVADSRYDLCAAGDPIEAIVRAVEPSTVDGYTLGSVQDGDRMTVLADGLQATPGTGSIAVGDYVVCGTVTAKGTALASNKPKVCKATQQPGITVPADLTAAAAQIKVAMFPWRVVSILSGTGAVGDTLVIERVGD